MRHDFNKSQIVEIIKSTCILVASVDCYSLLYCTRAFCLFEAFAAVAASEAGTECCSLLVYNTDSTEGNAPYADQFEIHASRIVTPQRLKSTPIDSASASTRSEEDKQKFDAFISRTIGFNELDDALTEAVTASAYINSICCFTVNFALIVLLLGALMWHLICMVLKQD
jgi:hypothetical protein